MNSKKLIDIAIEYVGYPSVKYTKPENGCSINGFDCSGFMYHVLEKMDIKLLVIPGTNRKIRHSEEFFDYFGINIHKEAIRTGDLVFFSKNGVRPTHLGLYIEDNKLLHSPGLDNTKINIVNLEEFISRQIITPHPNYEQIYFNNPIGYKRPSLPNIEKRGQIII